MDQITFVYMHGDDTIGALDELQTDGLVTESDTKATDLGLDPATIIALTGAAILVARFAISIWERWRGGVRIDLGTTPVTVERMREVPYGMVIVLASDGDVRIETRDEPKEVVERILTAIFSLPVPADSQQVQALLVPGMK